jgi:hypothetical protein
MQKLYAARLKSTASYLAVCSPPSSPIHAFTQTIAQNIIVGAALQLGLARVEHGNIVLV